MSGVVSEDIHWLKTNRTKYDVFNYNLKNINIHLGCVWMQFVDYQCMLIDYMGEPDDRREVPTPETLLNINSLDNGLSNNIDENCEVYW